MNKMFICGIVLAILVGCDSNNTSNSDIDKILSAKAKVRSIVNYPDTLSFHEFDTDVRGNAVFLKFTCKNAFGVPETHHTVITVD